MTNTNPTTSVLARLRALAPRRGLSESTARGIAERQASLLLKLTHTTVAPISLRLLEGLPRVEVGLSRLPTSGVSYWTGTAWRLEANQAEPLVRQRFTLAHEFKHVIDHPVRDLLYGDHGARERVADHFAACLLMPKRLVVATWCSGEQDPSQLAEQFVVSTEAMTRRLNTLGLTDAQFRRPIYCTRGANALRTAPQFAIAERQTIGAAT